MKNILLPTDFSDNAYNALRYAAELYKEEDCTFFLLNTYTPPIQHAKYAMDTPAQCCIALSHWYGLFQS